MLFRNMRPSKRRSSYIKCVVFFLTTILLLIGLGVFGTIALIKLRYSHGGINIPDIGFIVLAALVCLIALVGYWATCQNSHVLFKLFIGALIVLACLFIMIDIMVFTQPQVTEELVTKVWANLNDHGRIEFQKMLLCCDVTTNKTMTYVSTFHLSCFKDDKKYARGEFLDAVYRKDCFKALVEFFHKYMYLISGIIGGVIILNIVLMLLSCVLLIGRSDDAKEKRKYFSFPIVTDVILWKRRTKRRLRQIESGIFELPPTYPTGPILQAYKNSIEKSHKV